MPLYPQFSTTTSGSSLDAWREAAAKVGLGGADQDHLLLSFRSRFRRRDGGHRATGL
ncbi:MAG: hypothetical protein RML45_09770 [Acetobacteraceae bacterium]|nr:hypothetical protein [Acetobacteraceae bacterium]